MKLFIIVICCLMAIVCRNYYKFKRIKRRIYIKKMKVDDSIIGKIDDFKNEVYNDNEIKAVINKSRIFEIVKKTIYAFMLIAGIFLPAYCIYKIGIKGEMLSGQLFHWIITSNAIILLVCLFALVFIELFGSSVINKNNRIWKEFFYNHFIKRIINDIKWYDKNEYTSSNLLIRECIDLKKNYSRASFNKIKLNEEIVSHSDFKKVLFDDYISGIFKDKFSISLADYRESIFGRSYFSTYSRELIRLNEGVFCLVKINKRITNDIRITSKRKHSSGVEKHYMVNTMTDDFSKDFIILAKDGYQISEKISQRSIEVLEKFYNNSKIDFDISIMDNEIFFRFKTIDTMEFNIWKSSVDDLMMKEYASIILFVTELSEEISDNWTV